MPLCQLMDKETGSGRTNDSIYHVTLDFNFNPSYLNTHVFPTTHYHPYNIMPKYVHAKDTDNSIVF